MATTTTLSEIKDLARSLGVDYPQLRWVLQTYNLTKADIINNTNLAYVPRMHNPEDLEQVMQELEHKDRVFFKECRKAEYFESIINNAQINKISYNDAKTILTDIISTLMTQTTAFALKVNKQKVDFNPESQEMIQDILDFSCEKNQGMEDLLKIEIADLLNACKFVTENQGQHTVNLQMFANRQLDIIISELFLQHIACICYYARCFFNINMAEQRMRVSNFDASLTIANTKHHQTYTFT